MELSQNSKDGAIVYSNHFITIDTVFDSNGTNITCHDRCDDKCSESVDSENEHIFSKENQAVIFPAVIYRFKFSEEFMEELYNFSKIHQYDDRHEFKDAWKVWVEENVELVNSESRRLTSLGYDGDIICKMFKSARYYFRKKSMEKKEPRKRREYISVNKELLDAMDNHIERKIYNNDYKPQTGFIDFCKENELLLKEAITKIFENGIKDSKLIENKIKKTYKNRYFMLTNKRAENGDK